MKKIRLTLLMLMAFMMSLASFGQSTLTVNDGTATSSYVPVYGLYMDDYLKCEYVIPAENLTDMTGGTISAMTFYLSSVASASWGSASFQVFMKEVDATTISAYTGTDDATIVYEGSLDGTQSEMMVEFTTPYTYNGGNLLVGFYNVVEGTFKSASFYGVTATGACVQGYSGSSLAAVSANQRNFLPKTTFTYAPGALTCPRPTDLTSSNVTATSVDLSWTAGGSETAWTLLVNGNEVPGITENPYTLEGLTPETAYSIKVQANCAADDASLWSNTVSFTTPPSCIAPAGLSYTALQSTSVTLSWTANNDETEWTLEVNGEEMTGITENPYTLNGLTPATAYTVKVKANCSATDASAWSNTVNFTTECVTVVVTEAEPFIENFSNDGACWTLNDYVNGTTAWTIATTLSNNGAVSSLYDGACAKFYASNYTDVTKLVSPVLDLSALGSSALLTFQMANAQWIGDLNTMRVYYRTSSAQDWVELAYYDEEHTSWEEQMLILPNVTASYQIAFEGIADYGYAIFIDDVSVAAAPACAAPSLNAAENITTTSATISWTANSGETEWTIELNGEEITGITENPYTFEDLDPATAYTVRVKANCSATESSDWSSTVTFSTACDVIVVTDDNPYQEGFENTTDWGCWSAAIEAGTVNWTHSSYNAVEGSQCAYLNYDATDARLTSPIFDLTGVTTPQLTFSHRQAVYSGGVDELYVYYRTAPEEEWVELAAYTTTYASMTEETILLPNASATYQISFLGHCVDALGIYLDDVNVFAAPTCIAPSDVTVDAVTTTTATISWTDNNETAPQGWTIDVNGNEVAASTNPFTLDNLTAATIYTVKVKANCADDDESDWSAEVTFTTECTAIVVTASNPYQEGFENGATCWSMESISGNYNWVIYNTTAYAFEGAYVALAPYQPDNVTRLISPVFDLTALENPTFTFQRLQMEYEDEDYGTITIDEMDVYYRTSETEEWVLLANYSTANTAYEMETFTLPNPSATYQISFLATGHDGNNILLDDINIFGAEETPCATPTNVTFANGVVTWTGNAANYNVHIVAGETTIDTTVNTTSYTVEGLNNGDHATVTVQAVCSEDNLSEWSEAVEFDYITDGINNHSINANIYPNPTTGNVTVESNAINADITVFDMFGKLMMTSKVASERTELDFSGFASGVYMVRIANSNAITTVKVVKE